MLVIGIVVGGAFGVQSRGQLGLHPAHRHLPRAERGAHHARRRSSARPENWQGRCAVGDERLTYVARRRVC